MTEICEIKSVILSGILAALKSMLEKLGTCERALIDFTHKQCSRFPRFYFLSAKDVFHIMCHGRWNLVRTRVYLARVYLARVYLARVYLARVHRFSYS